MNHCLISSRHLITWYHITVGDISIIPNQKIIQRLTILCKCWVFDGLVYTWRSSSVRVGGGELTVIWNIAESGSEWKIWCHRSYSLSVFLCVCVCVCVFLPLSLPMYTWPYACRSAYLCVWLPDCLRISVCFSFCQLASLSGWLPTYASVCLSRSVCLSVFNMFFIPSVCLPPFRSLYVCLSLSFWPFVCPSICPSVCLFVSPFSLSAYPSLSTCLFSVSACLYLPVHIYVCLFIACLLVSTLMTVNHLQSELKLEDTLFSSSLR